MPTAARLRVVTLRRRPMMPKRQLLRSDPDPRPALAAAVLAGGLAACSSGAG